MNTRMLSTSSYGLVRPKSDIPCVREIFHAMQDRAVSDTSRLNDPDFWVASHHERSITHMGYRVDTYGGIIFDTSDLPQDTETFRDSFSRSIEFLTAQGYSKGFWISIPASRSELVPVIMKEFGFYVHHAKKDYFMLVRWNDPQRPDPIPAPSMHQVGVGCVIARTDGCILLVKERTGPAAVKGGIWKLPTGLVDPAENLKDAAVREAKEETCLDCVFESVICFRHSHGGSPALGATSDLFFACLLRLKDNSQATTLQESEILDSCWVHFSRIHEVTGCAPGTAARELMERIVEVISQNPNRVISCKKLPAWRRVACDQWIYSPHSVMT